MMKAIDAVSSYIGPLIKKYPVAALFMCENDIRQRPFAYNFDVFFNCSNCRYVQNVDLLPDHTIVPTVRTLLVLYHNLTHFSLSCSSILANQPLPLFRVLLFHPKILRGYHLTQFLIHWALS